MLQRIFGFENLETELISFVCICIFAGTLSKLRSKEICHFIVGVIFLFYHVTLMYFFVTVKHKCVIHVESVFWPRRFFRRLIMV